MSAPAAVNVHGAPGLHSVTDEVLSSAVVLAVEEFTFEDGTSIEYKQDADKKTVYSVGLNPHASGNLKGKQITDTGISGLLVGSRVTTLSNFAATRGAYDPSVGTILTTSNKSTSKRNDNQIDMDVGWAHWPFIITQTGQQGGS